MKLGVQKSKIIGAMFVVEHRLHTRAFIMRISIEVECE